MSRYCHRTTHLLCDECHATYGLPILSKCATLRGNGESIRLIHNARERETPMATITKRGRELSLETMQAGVGLDPWRDNETATNLAITLSLIARHAKTSRNLCEIMCSGHPIYGGEWVNTHYEWLEKRDAQIDARLVALSKELPANVRLVTGGDPRGWVVRLIVTDENGVERTVGVD